MYIHVTERTEIEEYPFAESVKALKAENFVLMRSTKTAVFFRNEATRETAKLFNNGHIVVVGDGLVARIAHAISDELSQAIRDAVGEIGEKPGTALA